MFFGLPTELPPNFRTFIDGFIAGKIEAAKIQKERKLSKSFLRRYFAKR
jgi:hypothetical protein